MTSLQEILTQYSQKTIGLSELKTHLLACGVVDSSHLRQVVSELQSAAQTGLLSSVDCSSLIAMLESGAGAVDVTQSRTMVKGVDATHLHVGPTAAATLYRKPDAVVSQTASAAVEETFVTNEGRVQSPGQSDYAAAQSSAESTTNNAMVGKPAVFEPGALINNRFLLKESIGRGGMGVVFAAIDRRKTEARDPNPQVAIKILNTDFAHNKHALIALQREARKSQTLAHPNVATVFDFDRDGDTVFMTMELLLGRSLETMVREVRGVGMGRTAWPIVRGIAEGLAYAHRKGIVHSDLKPGNVFLLEDNTPKILDFGIARAIPVAGVSTAFQDVFDAGVLGAYTESYATVEMIEGSDPHPADDVYALGLIAYELIAGTHPYQRYGIVKARELGLKPEPPKGLSRREWRVLQSSLAFERNKRPRDAADFLKRLTGITRLQQWLIGATVLLAMASGFFWHRSYVAEGPAIPFAQLPTETQQQFTAYMQEGDQLWRFYEKDHNLLALQEAVEQYAAAYQLHPRNRDSTHALIKSADAILDETKSNPKQQREFARMLAARSELLSKYPPVMSAAQ